MDRGPCRAPPHQQRHAGVIHQARGTADSGESLDRWLVQHHYTQWVKYEPATRFWHFQTIGAAVYAVVALALCAATVLVGA